MDTPAVKRRVSHCRTPQPLQVLETKSTAPRLSRPTLPSARHLSRSGGGVARETAHPPAAPRKNPGPPARQSAVRGEDVIYISICSGGPIIKISAVDRPKYVLGQLIILGAIVVVALVELTLWLVN